MKIERAAVLHLQGILHSFFWTRMLTGNTLHYLAIMHSRDHQCLLINCSHEATDACRAGKTQKMLQNPSQSSDKVAQTLTYHILAQQNLCKKKDCEESVW